MSSVRLADVRINNCQLVFGGTVFWEVGGGADPRVSVWCVRCGLAGLTANSGCKFVTYDDMWIVYFEYEYTW